MNKEKFKFFLAHHFESNYDRCIPFKVFNETWYVCTRCLALYSFFILFSIIFHFFYNLSFIQSTMIMIFFPIPAFVDWVRNQLNIDSGTNYSRFITGGLLGISYSAILYSIVHYTFNPITYIVILSYIIIIMILIKKIG